MSRKKLYKISQKTDLKSQKMPLYKIKTEKQKKLCAGQKNGPRPVSRPLGPRPPSRLRGPPRPAACSEVAFLAQRPTACFRVGGATSVVRTDRPDQNHPTTPSAQTLALIPPRPRICLPLAGGGWRRTSACGQCPAGDGEHTTAAARQAFPHLPSLPLSLPLPTRSVR